MRRRLLPVLIATVALSIPAPPAAAAAPCPRIAVVHGMPNCVRAQLSLGDYIVGLVRAALARHGIS